MQIDIHRNFADHPDAEEARSIIRACVHCGFCNATCPTYLELGDERDGPRGRIYLLKQLLEDDRASERTLAHIDRCLTCRNCETTCPSGVEYGRLVDIGKGILERRIERPIRERILRRLIKSLVPYRRRFALLLQLGRSLRPVLPQRLRQRIPLRPIRASRRQAETCAEPKPESLIRKMILPPGCVQPSAAPNTDEAARRILARLGIDALQEARGGCCGALHYHLGDHDDGLAFARRNIEAWWPAIEAGAEAIVITASGCGTMIKDYGYLLRHDTVYAEKAARISELAKDVAEILNDADLAVLRLHPPASRVAWQSPCSLQHGQKLGGLVERILHRCGFRLTSSKNAHLCCGSAGSYSILQPVIGERLRERKLAALMQGAPDLIVTANVGCQLHLQAAARVPVKHWLELLDEACA